MPLNAHHGRTARMRRSSPDPRHPAMALAAALALAGAAAAGPAPTDALRDPPQGIFSDMWYAVLISGKKSGHMHVAAERRGDAIRTRTELAVELKRERARITVSIESEEEESLSGAARGFTLKQRLGTGEIVQRGRVVADELHLVSEQLGRRLERKLPWRAGDRMSWGLQLALLDTGLRAGAAFRLRVFDPALVTAVETGFRVGGEETIDLMGRKARAVRVSSTAALHGSTIRTETWMDHRYRTLAVETSLGGIRMRMIACPREIARRPGDPAELFVSTLVPIDRSLDRRTLRKLVLRFRVEGGEGPEIPETGMQRVRRTGPGRWEIEIERGRRDPMPADEETLRRCLRPSLYANGDDPAIRRMAREAAGAEKDPARVADLLRRHVTRIVSRKTLNVGFATASEVAVTREGDCSEHAVLLAALGRARGIPSRAAAGLIYLDRFGGRRNVFGFHMWTQMYIGGRWADLDAMFGQSEADATHLALAILPFADEDGLDPGVEILAVAGRCRIDVLEAVEAPAAPVPRKAG